MRRENYTERAVGGLALGVSTISGSTFNAFAKSLSMTLSSLSLLFVSELLTGLFVIMSCGILPVVNKLFRLHKRELFWLLTMAALSGIFGPLLLFSGLGMTSAVNAGFFGKMQIIFMLLFAHFLLKEKMTKAYFIAVACIMTGISIIMLHGFTSGLSLEFGDVLIIASTLCYALGSIVFRAKLQHIEPHIALFVRSSVAVGIFFLASPFIQHPFIEEIRQMPSMLFPSLFGFAFISRYLNGVTYYAALDRIPISTVSLVGSLEIVGATFFSFWYLGEPIHWYHVAGGAFVILGNILLEALGPHQAKEILQEQLKQKTP